MIFLFISVLIVTLLIAGCAGRVRFESAAANTPTLSAALFRPEATTPRPALVLLHPCSGLLPFMTDWAHWLQSEGYVALVVDSFSAPGRADERLSSWAQSHDAGGGPPCQLAGMDTEIPLLMLFGGADDWTRPERCISVGERLQRDKRPVRWVVYPGAPHGFDQPGPPRTSLGHHIAYDDSATADARNQVRQFLADIFH